MKRDCGKGELVVDQFVILWNVGKSDTDRKITISSKHYKLNDAIDVYNDTLSALPEYSSIRLYLQDKQGYRNCILSTYVTPNGIEQSTNRLDEV